MTNAGDKETKGENKRRGKRVYFETGYILSASRAEDESEGEVERGRRYVTNALRNVEALAAGAGSGLEVGGRDDGVAGEKRPERKVQRLEAEEDVRECFWKSGDSPREVGESGKESG